MKKKISSLLLAILMLTTCILPVSVFGAETPYKDAKPITELNGGAKTAKSGDIYSVSNADELMSLSILSNEANKYFDGCTIIFTADINLNPGWIAGDKAPEKVWTPVAEFKGSIDGQGHIISGLYSKGGSQTTTDKPERIAMFGIVSGANVEFKNFTVINSYFEGEKDTAGLAGYWGNEKGDIQIGLISNVVMDVKVVNNFTYSSGFIGEYSGPNSAALTLKNCVSSGDYSVYSQFAGGFFGAAWKSFKMEGCIFDGHVSGPTNIGGFIGLTQTGHIQDYNSCMSNGVVESSGQGTITSVGGFIGVQYGKANFTDCVSYTNIITGEQSVSCGGFIGYQPLFEATFTRCIYNGTMDNKGAYYSNAFIGRAIPKHPNEDMPNKNNGVIEFTDSYYVKRPDPYSRAVGVYRGDGSSNFIYEIAYTVEEINVTKKYSEFNSTAWNNYKSLNQPFVDHGRKDDNELKGVIALETLKAFDFKDVWVLFEDKPVPKKALNIENNGSLIDAKFITGNADQANKILTDEVESPTYEFKINSRYFNSIEVYADAALTKKLDNKVRFMKNGENVYYVVLLSYDKSAKEVWTAKIKTNGVNPHDYDIENEVYWFGRTYKDGDRHWFNWTASGFSFNFKGSGAKAVITSALKNHEIFNAFVKVTVDGVPVKKIELAKEEQEVVLCKDLDATKEHTVRVEMITGNDKAAAVALKSLSILDGEKMLPNGPSSDALNIEIIGDSIAVGFGSLGNPENKWTSLTEDGTLSYTSLAARMLGANYNVVASSGKGIVKNYGGGEKGRIPEIYKYIDGYNFRGTDWKFSNFPTDVVIIDLGDNDSSVKELTEAEFEAGCLDFVKLVRKNNPNAAIIYSYGILNPRFAKQIENVVKTLNDAGDKNIYYLPINPISEDELGVIGHPALNANMDRAKVLAAKIAEVTKTKVKNEVEDILRAESKLTVEMGNGNATPIEFPEIEGIYPEPEPEVPAETTTAEETTVEAGIETTAATTEEKKKGCGSDTSAAFALVFVAVISTAAVVTKKRKTF